VLIHQHVVVNEQQYFAVRFPDGAIACELCVCLRLNDVSNLLFRRHPIQKVLGYRVVSQTLVHNNDLAGRGILCQQALKSLPQRLIAIVGHYDC
jgi:hypothetical protein